MNKGSYLEGLAALCEYRSFRVSSYDRTGGNADFVPIKPRQTGTIARIEGAGCIRHIWMGGGVDEKHWMPGKGVVDWGGFARALRAIGFRGPFNYEAKPHGETLAQRLAALEANFDWVCAKM